MAEALDRVEKKIDSLDRKVDHLEVNSASKDDVKSVDIRVQGVEKDVAAIKAVSSLPVPPKPQWPAVLGAVVGVVSALVSLATLLLVIVKFS